MRNMAEELERGTNNNTSTVDGEKDEAVVENEEGNRGHTNNSHVHKDDDDCMDGHQPVAPPSLDCSEDGCGGEDHDDHQHNTTSTSKEDEAKLMRMSINTAIAIGLHNFPEGLATFVAALDDPKVGVVLAVAIAIHNIPEGLCVALPIYYATGKRWKAFWWAVLSGASEPVAALLGWAVLANSFSSTLYGILFGMVAGMMVIISVRELLPTSHRYDPEDSVVTYSFILGMTVMALSLVLFVL